MQHREGYAVNPLYAWLKDRGHWIGSTQSSSRTCTHTFFDGGKASVPDDDVKEFWKQYAIAIKKGHLQYAIERTSTPTFKFFVDLDVDADTISSVFEGEKDPAMVLIQRMFRQISKMYSSSSLASGEAVVCLKRRAVSSTSYDADASKEKVGAHVVWPHILVNAQSARKLAAVCADALARTTSDTQIADKLRRVVDTAVYKNNGLRMILSLKPEKPMAYVPTHVASCKDGVVTPVDTTWLTRLDDISKIATWVERCSVRVIKDDDDNNTNNKMVILERDDTTPTELSDSIVQRDLLKIAPSRRRAVRAAVVSPEMWENIRRQLPEPYHTCRLRNSKVIGDGRAYVLSTDSTYCLNVVGGYHKNAHTFFVAIVGGCMYQRCTCRCDDVEKRTTGQKCCDTRHVVLKQHTVGVADLLPAHAATADGAAEFWLRLLD